MKWQVYGVRISTIISAIGLGLIIWKTDPAVTPPLLKTSFFIALFILIWGSSTLIIFSIKNRFIKSRLPDEDVYESIFNTSILLGLFFPVVIVAITIIKKLL